jgi:V/A-type H+-transporting ATPase subunit A
MMGIIKGISGPTVSVELKGLRLYERVYVGHEMLTGEVVRLEKDRAMIQVYEDTRGLGIGEPVKRTGMPLTISLGPGLLSSMYDGLQRPLERLREMEGPFIHRGKDISSLDYSKGWHFHPIRKLGDEIRPGDLMGYVEEGHLRHPLTYITSFDALQKIKTDAAPSLPDLTRKILWLAEGEFSLTEPVARLDDGSNIYATHEWPVRIPRPYRRKLPPAEPVITGQRTIDFFFPLAKGGTVIMSGGFGTGKTILEQSVAKFAEADIVVYVGCGERGNEMAELIEDFKRLNDPWEERGLMERTILIVNTSNMPVAAREASIYTAVTIAEYYRDMGYKVLFLADSLSRWAEALREISSSIEEMPGEEGYPTYLASRLSGFMERSGIVETYSGNTGSLSMVLSVSPPGGDFTEPVTQACLRSAGAFLMLDTSLAYRRHFPAINWFQSYSLYEEDISRHCCEKIHPEWRTLQKRCREILHKEESLKEITEIVGVEGVQDSDRLLMRIAERIREEFLCQNAYTDDAFSHPERTISIIENIIDFYDKASGKLDEGVPLDEILSL